ncbi:DUF488 family protein [Methanosarcina sp.]|jgi:uncharacterized protein (DUF488 family)|uniref:DUF488 domain-containing protein n=1 Tax=Methanosarcina sp. TaxID=2213 RepID=UPI002C12AE25|nr:DUF488 family protein [Methanosarcina sp.]HOW13987.1 DUF488 family protein [Methanosarcina sp.]
MKNLNHRQRALLYTIDKLHEKDLSSRFMIVKSLFLSSHVEKIDKLIKFYHFFPHHYGPFSNVCYTDISKLQKEGYIIEKEKKFKLIEKGKIALKGIDQKATLKINRVVNKFDSDNEIMEYVYRKFPDYTIRSKLLPCQDVKKFDPGLFTIGYEGRDIDFFLNVLIQNAIDVLVDVRKNPFSMKFDFTKNSLKNYLENSEIRYLHIPELGIEGEKRKDLLTLKDYEKLFENYEKTTIKDHPELLDRITELSRSHRVALMCFEADVNMCHRGVIARNITQKENMKVLNI